MAKAKRLNKNLIVGLTAVGFVIMTAAGIILISRLEERNPQHFQELADQAFAKGEWQAARKLYARAYEVERDKVAAAAYLVQIGDTFLEEGDEPRAMSTWNQAVTRNTRLKEAYEKLIGIRLEYSRSSQPPDHWLALKENAEGLVGAEDDEEEDRLDAQNPKGLFALGVALVELDRQQQEEGDETLGREKIRQAMELAPSEVDYGVRLAQYHVNDRDFDGAENLFRQLVESNRDPGAAAVEARVQYADFLLSRQQDRSLTAQQQAQDRELAAQLLARASELAGRDPEARAKALAARARHALIRWQQSREGADTPEDVEAAEEARRLCKEAIEVDPDSFDAYRLLGNLYSMQDKVPEAIEVCEARLERPIIRVGSKRSMQKQLRYLLLLQAAELYRALALGQEAGTVERDEALSKALEYVREASAEFPGPGLTLETEASIRLAGGDVKEAIRLSQAADEVYGDRIVWRNKLRLATLLAREGELGAARKAIEAVCLNPQFAAPQSGVSAECWTNYAGILFQLGNEPQRVLFVTEEALRRDPSSVQAMSLQASVLRQLDREDEAQRVLDRIARLAGGEVAKQIRERELLRSARNLVTQQKPDEAVRLLLDALEEDPGNERYAVNAAMLLRRRDRNDEALRVLQKALEANPDSLSIKNALVRMDETITEDEQRAAIGAQLLEEIEKIEDEFTRAVEMAAYHSQPQRRNHAEADRYLAEAQRLFLAKATPEARAALPEALSGILNDRLQLALDNDNFELAQEVVRAAIEHNADHADGRTFLGQLRLRQAARETEQGRVEEGRRRKEEAAQAFKEALEKLPTNSRTLVAYGRVCLELNRVAEARIAFEEAAEINPRDATAWKGLAVIASLSGDDDLFARYVARCAELAPNDPAVRDWATVLEERESPADGIARREELRAKDPDDLRNLTRLARLYQLTDDNQKAEECYEQVLKHADAGSAEVWAAAEFYRATARPDRGLQLLQDLVTDTDDPDTKAEYQLLVGSYYANMDDIKQADTSMLAAADIKENQAVCVALGRHYFQTRQEDQANRLDRAVEWLEKAVALADRDRSPQAPWIRRMVIESFLTAGKRDQARARYEEYAARYPDDNDKLRLRAELEVDAGRPDRAIATLTEYLEQRPDDPRILFRRAQHFGAQGQWQRACADLERLRAANPSAEQFRPRILLARGYDLTGQRDLAETELKAALEEDPRADNVASELVNFYEKYERLSDAEKVVTAHLALAPDDALWLHRGGRLAQQQGNASKAIKLLGRSCELSEYDWRFVVALMDAFIQFKMIDAGISFYDDVLPPERRHQLVISKYARLLAMKGQTDMAVRVFCLAVDRTGVDVAQHLTAIAQDATVALGGAQAIDLFGVEQDDARLRRPAKTLHAVLLAGHQRIAEAMAATESLIETSESENERGSLMIMLALLKEQNGELEQARRCYEEGLKTFPDHVMALNNLAYLLAEDLDSPKLALPYAQKAARLTPNPQAETLDTLGWAYVKTGDYADAVSALARAVQLNEYYLPARAHLGEAYRLMGEFESALSTLKLAMRLIEETGDTEYRQAVETSLRKAEEGNKAP